MYSRYHNTPAQAIQVPKNYSGCAFHHNSPPSPSSESSHKIDIAKPSPLPKADAIEAPPPMPPPPRPVLLSTNKEKGEKSAANDSRLPQPFKRLFGNMGNAFPFSHGIGFDELLILGLIVLLSNVEQDSDLVLWLTLLLFCG